MMKRIVIVTAIVALMCSLTVWALGWSRQTTGHLIVTCTDKETGGPITNATVTVKTLNCLGPNAGVYESHYTKTSAMTDSNGVADVEFQFLVPDFEWEISTPSHYSWAVGIPDECFDAEIEPSDYEDIDESTPEGAAKVQQVRALHESEDWSALFRLFQPKSITCTNAVIRRSLSLMPKHNPQPMYVHDRVLDESILLPISKCLVTNNVELYEYPVVDVDMRKHSLLSPNGGKRNSGEVSDFKVVRYSIVTNGVKTYFGSIEFAYGCGAYKRKKTDDKSFNTSYVADTNAVYLSRIPYEYHSVSGAYVDVQNLLDKDEYMVLRTRVATNETGEVVDCHYSKIIGEMWVGEDLYFEQSVFNPIPNDSNLEPGENLARHR